MALPWPRPETGWFYDAQRPERRMRVSWHPDQRVAVVSFWDANICSGTFRLPVEDAGTLSQMLVGFLGDCVRSGGATVKATPRWIDRLRARFRPVLADVIHLVDRTR